MTPRSSRPHRTMVGTCLASRRTGSLAWLAVAVLVTGTLAWGMSNLPIEYVWVGIGVGSVLLFLLLLPIVRNMRHEVLVYADRHGLALRATRDRGARAGVEVDVPWSDVRLAVRTYEYDTLVVEVPSKGLKVFLDDKGDGSLPQILAAIRTAGGPLRT